MTTSAPDSVVSGPACGLPHGEQELIQLGHGSGGRMSADLIRDRFLPHFGNPALAPLGDGAVLRLESDTLVMSTDSFVVHPLEFPGGDIGVLAVHGTVNDVAMMGAQPRFLSAAFVIEEGLPLEVLERIVASMAHAATDAGVQLVTGDTKVVERGKGDGLFITTTGLGARVPELAPAPERARPGDAILVSGPIGRHGISIMAARGDLGFEVDVESDTAALWPMVERLRGVGAEVHVLRDPTRGGVASALNEIAGAAGVGIVVDAHALPVPDPVRAACEMLGLDPLYVANEGTMLAVVPESRADPALDLMRATPVGAGSQRVGTVVSEHPGRVVMHTGIGGTRIVDMLPGAQLPRIC